MTARHLRRLSLAGLVALAPALGLIATTSGSASALAPPSHIGDPRVWGPPLEQLCGSPAIAAASGYHVVVLDNLGNVYTGTSGPDAIFASGGNDTIHAGGGDDVVCGSFGNDTVYGDAGNDAIFGEEHNDVLRGNSGRDYLHGGSQTDTCNGGPALDREDDCQTVLSIP